MPRAPSCSPPRPDTATVETVAWAAPLAGRAVPGQWRADGVTAAEAQARRAGVAPAYGCDMTTAKRVQPGTPTGGQFAPTGHTESELALPAPTVSGTAPPPLLDLAAENSTLSAELAQLRDLEYRAELRATRLLAATVRAEYPDAKWIGLEYNDQGGKSMILDGVLDAEENYLVDDPWEMDSCDEATYLGTCLTEDGAWEMAKDPKSSAPWVDIDTALALQVPAPIPEQP